MKRAKVLAQMAVAKRLLARAADALSDATDEFIDGADSDGELRAELLESASLEARRAVEQIDGAVDALQGLSDDELAIADYPVDDDEEGDEDDDNEEDEEESDDGDH